MRASTHSTPGHAAHIAAQSGTPGESRGVDMRCDRCPAEAKVRYTKHGEQPWQWCAHHARRYDAGLTSTGWRRFALVKAPTSA